MDSLFRKLFRRRKRSFRYDVETGVKNTYTTPPEYCFIDNEHEDVINDDGIVIYHDARKISDPTETIYYITRDFKLRMYSMDMTKRENLDYILHIQRDEPLPTQNWDVLECIGMANTEVMYLKKDPTGQSNKLYYHWQYTTKLFAEDVMLFQGTNVYDGFVVKYKNGNVHFYRMHTPRSGQSFNDMINETDLYPNEIFLPTKENLDEEQSTEAGLTAEMFSMINLGKSSRSRKICYDHGTVYIK